MPEPLDYMDHWQVECATRLMIEGHDFGYASLLARFSRDMLEASPKPGPLCLVTGI